jgi:hypothetical protein
MRCHHIRPLLVGLALFSLQPLPAAEFAVSGLFGPGAVIQHGAPAPVFGTASPGTNVTVSIQGKTAAAVADHSGRWKADLPALAPGGPFPLEVSCGGEVRRSPVMVGDVWLVTGSPDLLQRPASLSNLPADETVPIRMLVMPYRVADSPQADVQGQWQAVPADAADRSLPAAFALRLHALQPDRPVGVILAASEIYNRAGGDSFDGDIVEAWAPPDVIDSLPWADELRKRFTDGMMLRAHKRRFDEQLAAWKRRGGGDVPDTPGEYDVWFYEKREQAKQASDVPPRAPTAENMQAPSRVWNGMLAPLAPARLAGIVFAPGTGNLGNPAAVAPIMERAIPVWRAAYGQPELPVICLGTWPGARVGEGYLAWSELADAFRPLAALPGVALVPFHDLYDLWAHGSRLEPDRFAERLAPVAQGPADKKPVPVAPVITSAAFRDGAAVLTVNDPALLPPAGTVIDGFTIYSPKTHWVWATGTVRDGGIVVSHPHVSAPAAVRYGWSWDRNHPHTLKGPGGIPSPTFRTDTMTMCWSQLPGTGIVWSRRSPPPAGHSFIQQIDIFPIADPMLPWVMTMGDSIHSGYKDGVQKHLAGKVNLVPITVPHSVKGALAGPRPLWGITPDELAVLHINHGLHGDASVPPAEFEQQLDDYFTELKKAVGSGRVVWAATTPIPSKEPGTSLNPEYNPGIIRINEVARRLCKKHGFAFNDLYALVVDDVDTLTVAKGNVHYNPQGNAILSKAVADAIQTAIQAGIDAASDTPAQPASPTPADALDGAFLAPPPPARTHVWWHWMGPFVSLDGITKDLEAMASSGIGGATIFNLHAVARTLPRPDVWPKNAYRSQEWWALVEHAAREADRLGLNLGIHNCVGYSASGGPWITPDREMQKLVWSETTIPADGAAAARKPFAGRLPHPDTKAKLYRDIAVIAIPDGPAADRSAFHDLSTAMAADGTIEWTPPPGDWTIYRFGYVPAGKACHPVPPGVNAPECDKLSASAAQLHIEQVLQPLKEHLGPLMGRSLRHVTFDSYEAGNQDWTADFAAEFQKRRGYSPLPWLPVLAGRVIGDEDLAARFRHDFKATVSDLFIQNNLRVFRRAINDAGMEMMLQPYGGPFDRFAAATTPDVPMYCFWTSDRVSLDTSTRAGPAAAAAGISLVAAEAFTGTPDVSTWTETPVFLKPFGDAGFCQGLNQLFLHSWVQQPFTDSIRPGVTMGRIGTHFSRHQTWFEPGKAFFAYLNRCQAVLQRGELVSDYLVLDEARPHADTIPTQTLLDGLSVEKDEIVVPCGRRYPFLVMPKPVILPEVARAVKQLVAAGATVVGPRPERSPSLRDYPACDAEVQAIAAEVWGPQPAGPSVTEHAFGQGRVSWKRPEQVLAELKIGPAFSHSPRQAAIRFTHRRDGDVDVYFLANLAAEPVECATSFRIAGKIPEVWDAVRGTQADAERWRITDGRTEVPLHFEPYESMLVVFRRSAGADMAATPAAAHSSPPAPLPEPIEITGPWTVTFQHPVGAPQTVRFDTLSSWTEADDRDIRFFSGTARYVTDVTIPSAARDDDTWLQLDLGNVRDLAQVRIDGTLVGTAWCPPYRLDVTAALPPGRHRLEIDVTNTWANRLIGDHHEPEDCRWSKELMQDAANGTKTSAGRVLEEFPEWVLANQPRPTARRAFSSWDYFTKESPLRESGLLGPVTVRASSGPIQAPRDAAAN